MSLITTPFPQSALASNVTYQKSISTNSTKFFTSRLLNYVEPVDFGAYRKTAFYTEVNTNFNVGDRVFILNGNYDSNDYIEQDKYNISTDGYVVLGVDGCRVILDIDYTETEVYNDMDIDQFIKINVINSQRSFDYANDITIVIGGSASGYTSGIHSKFYGKQVGMTYSLYTNDIIFSTSTFSGTSSYTGVGIGFWMRDDSAVPYTWVNITSPFLSNTMYYPDADFPNNDIGFVVGEDFVYNGNKYHQRLSYTYKNNLLVADTTNIQPFISKLNFRFGTFKGVHNDGIFGSNDKVANWNNAVWNSGSLVNSNWNSGVMSSKSNTGDQSYYSKIQISNGATAVTQTVDYSNNKGYGYNFVINSEFYSGSILNGNFSDCTIGISSTYSAVDSYYGITSSPTIVIKNGQYALSEISDVSADNSLFVNSIVYNSLISNSKITNSQIYNSVSDYSQYTSDSGINIIGADIWSYDTSISIPSPNSTTIRGILKLYISTDDLYKIDNGDAFYIVNINKEYFLSSLSNDQRIKLPIETKFIFDSYFDTELSNSKIIVTRKSKTDNTYKMVVTTSVIGGTQSVNTIYPNNMLFDSIDIDCQELGYYYDSSGNVVYLNGNSNILYPITLNNVNNVFLNTYLMDSDYKSGILDNSTWISGGSIGYRQNIINKYGLSPSDLDISYSVYSNSLDINVLYNPMNYNNSVLGEDIFIGDTVWLNSIDFISGSSSIQLDGRYKVNNVTPYLSAFPQKIKYTLTPQSIGLTSIGTMSGVFVVSNAETNNYVSISKFIINNSMVNSGLFVRNTFTNTIFNNSQFDNTDTVLVPSNVSLLRLINTIFNNNNIINDGVIYKSHFISDTCNSGLVYNSIWNGGTFTNGIFKSSYWVNGTFNGGKFIDSNDTFTSSVSYDNLPQLKSWLTGTFNNGEFYNSIWADGIFNNGRFYKSDWYGGIWNNGVLGSKNLNLSDTTFGNYSSLSFGASQSFWYQGIVENALVGGSGSVYWYQGSFNNGEFTSYGSVSNIMESIWYDGNFNGGKITNLARWKNGNFNNGKFLSYYGYNNVAPLNSSTYSTDYAWEHGKFNGGVFGNANTATNSVWYDGEFDGGVFQGRYWNSGVFTNGSFIGSGPTSVSINSYVSSFTNSYFGLWNSGWVSDRKNLIKTNDIISSVLVRYVEQKHVIQTANLSNILWMTGTFSHTIGNLSNSAWLDGNFINGNFNSSIFNPYVDRTFSESTTYSFNFNSTCVWNGGNFNGGNFYISQWFNGNFNSGNMIGGIWRNGTWNYGNANNVYWETGRWRNGIWNGSPFVSTTQSGTSSLITPLYTLNSGFEHDILTNISQYTGDDSMHIINAFSGTSSAQFLSDPNANVGLDTSIGQPSIISESFWTSGGLAANWSTSTSLTGYNVYPLFVNETVTLDNSISFLSNPSTSDTLYLTCPASIFGGSGVTTSVLQKPSSFSIYSDELVNYNVSITYAIEPNTSGYYTYNFASGTYIFHSPASPNNQVSFMIKYGLTSSTTITNTCFGQSYIGHTVYAPLISTFNFSLSESDISLVSGAFEPRTIKINKVGTGLANLKILSASVKATVIGYDGVNNTLYPSFSDLTYGATISFPDNLSLSVISSRYLVPLTFGNGVFKSGIWENGAWNNGWRGDDYLKPFVLTTSTYIGNNTWSLTLYGLNSDSTVIFNPGDKISIGNIVSIDVNSKRTLIKDYFTIDSVSAYYITCRVSINFPIRGIVIDTMDNSSFANSFYSSEKLLSTHINYVTKNIWLSGVFLNGYFKGIWNNGLFKGRPFLTLMENSQWIDGEFDGGHFRGLTESTDISYLSYLNSTSDPGANLALQFIYNNFNGTDPSGLTLSVIYNQSLIQNFTFYDNNIANPYKFLFNSWMDINYSLNSQTNIYQEKNYFDFSNSLNTWGTDTVLSKANLNGAITNDILSSLSYFRNGYDGNQKIYSLGTKYTKYTDYLDNVGSFNNLFSNESAYELLGMSSFINDNWSIKSRILSFGDNTKADFVFDINNPTGYGVPLVTNFTASYASQSGNIILYPEYFKISNIDSTLTITASNVITLGTYSDQWTWNNILVGTTQYHNLLILNNETTKNIPSQRYSMIEMQVLSFTGFPGPIPYTTRSVVNGGSWVPPSIHYGVNPATWSLTQVLSNPLYDYDGSNWTYNSGDVKREFFYNRHSLLLEIIANDYQGTVAPGGNYPLSVTFDNLHFYEVDMIPFFQYTTASSINTNILPPYYVTSVPQIDYGNSGFDYVGNVTITITSTRVNESLQPPW